MTDDMLTTAQFSYFLIPRTNLMCGTNLSPYSSLRLFSTQWEIPLHSHN